MMGEARNRFNGEASLIDTSVSDRAIRRAKREFCSQLSERLLIAMMNVPWNDPEATVQRAWALAELHYEEMLRRMALRDAPVSLTERMAADQTVSEMSRAEIARG
jgi:hypothetical protein